MAKNENLLPASFRGAPFFVSSITMGFGRRGVMHHSPFNDTPFYEDLGRKGRSFTVEAYVMSDRRDEPQIYERTRDKLIKAIEKGGAGVLIHPTMGRMNVVPIDCSVTFNNSEGRIEALTITFAEEGERISSERNFEMFLEDILWTYDAKQATVFADDYTVGGDELYTGNATVPDSFLKSLTKKLQGFLDTVDDLAKNTAKDTNATDFSKDFLELSATLATAPQSIMASASTVFAPLKRIMTGLSLITDNPLDKLKNSLSIFGDFFGLAKKSRTKLKAMSTKTKGSPQYKEAQSKLALDVLIMSAAISEVSSATLEVDFEDTRTITEYKGYINEVFEDIILFVGDGENLGMYDTLLSIQSNLNQYINEELIELPNVIIIKNPKVRPALVIAYDQYEDSERSDELITRNSLANPNSVPVGNLEVLS